MTAAWCLTERAVWCWLTQIMTHHRASLVTDPASWPFYFLGTSQQSFHITYHMSMSHIANRLHDDRQYGDCEMSGDINRLLMFTVDCTGVAILSSQCAGDSDTCADPHLHHRLVRSTSQTGLWLGPGQTGHTGHYAMCWAGPVAAGGCVHFTICFVPQLFIRYHIQHCLLESLMTIL